MKRCENCYYWWAEGIDEDVTNAHFGHCHRYAPKPSFETTLIHPDVIADKCVLWPKTNHICGCGEWTPMELELS